MTPPTADRSGMSVLASAQFATIRRWAVNPLTQGVIWSGVGSALYQVLTVLATVLAARLLGPTSFGEYGIVLTTVAAVTSFIGPAISLTAAKFVAEHAMDDQDAVSRTVSGLLGIALTAGGVATFGLLVLAPAISVHVFKSSSLTVPLRIGGLAVFFSLIASTQAGVLVGLAQFRRQAYVSIGRGVVSLVATAGLTMVFGVMGAVVALVLVNVFWAVGNHLEIARHCVVSLDSLLVRPMALWRKVGGFSIPAMLQAMIWPVAIWGTTSLLARRGEGLHELGIFNAANLWRNAILFVPIVASQPLLSFLARARAAGDVRQYRRVFGAGTVLGMAAAFAAAIIVLVANQLIVRSYGDDFANAGAVLPIIVLGSVLSAYSVVVSPLIYTLDHMWAGVVFNILSTTALMLSCRLFIAQGAVGLAWAYVVSGTVQCLLGIGVSFLYLRQLGREAPLADPGVVGGGAIAPNLSPQ